MEKTKDQNKVEHPQVKIEKLQSGYLVVVARANGKESFSLFGSGADYDVERMAVITLADVVKILKETFEESTVSPLEGL